MRQFSDNNTLETGYAYDESVRDYVETDSWPMEGQAPHRVRHHALHPESWERVA